MGSAGTTDPHGRNRGGERGLQIVATIINLGRNGATNVRATEANGPGALAGALAFRDEASNEAGEGLGHLVRKRHHAS